MNILELKSKIDSLLESPKLRQLGKTQMMNMCFDQEFEKLKDQITAEHIADSYELEIRRTTEDGELIDDQEFQKALKTVFDYFATPEQKSKFNLTHKKQ